MKKVVVKLVMFMHLKTFDAAVAFRWSDWHETEHLGSFCIQEIQGHFAHNMFIPAKQLRQLQFYYYT